MRKFRPGATWFQFLIWTATLLVAGILFERHALRGAENPWVFHVLFTACLVLGPVAFIAHLVRRHLVWVEIIEEGLRLSGRRTIPWDAIEKIERRRGPFMTRGSIEDLSDSGGCLDLGPEGCLWVPVIIVAGGIIYFIFLPVLSLLSPWHPRVVLHLKDGSRIVYRDLDDDENFHRLVLDKIRVR